MALVDPAGLIPMFPSDINSHQKGKFQTIIANTNPSKFPKSGFAFGRFVDDSYFYPSSDPLWYKPGIRGMAGEILGEKTKGKDILLESEHIDTA